MTEIASLAKVIHDESCDRVTYPDGKCPSWDGTGGLGPAARGARREFYEEYSRRHREFSEQRAESIMARLGPVIGAANVAVACRVILEEMA